MVKFKASKEMDNDTTSNTAEKLQQLYAKELGSSKLAKIFENPSTFEIGAGKKYSKIPGIDFQYVIAKYVLATKYPKYSQVEQNLSNPRIKLWIGRYMALGKYLVWCIFDQCNKANFAGANAETREQEERIVTNATSDEINMALEKVVKHFYQVFYTIYGMIELRFNVEDAFSVFMQHFSDHIKDDMTEGYDHVKAAEKIFETFATQKMVDDIKQILNF
ncbi:hypothetical protein H4219_003991 [Mycoemilia scoparia]|uniref:Uncharacterized protein n=1 Tax=Mycoemilia scoparia TaxID=417184 RepID=A0A9W8DM48_9FUNG|nr:hypothetical protein H4219_003991 [Mycoemilia scoparia]